MSYSIRFGLPYLAPGQTQKEVRHNEALQRIDMLMGACVEEPPRASPPPNPMVGACFLTAAESTGAWEGHDHALASFTSAGWIFAEPVEGLKVLVRSLSVDALYRSGNWIVGDVNGLRLLVDGQPVVGSRKPDVQPPSGGPVVDTEARRAITDLIGRLRAHGLIG